MHHQKSTVYKATCPVVNQKNIILFQLLYIQYSHFTEEIDCVLPIGPWLTNYHMFGNFCGVKIFVELSYPWKLLNITKWLEYVWHENINPWNHLSFLNHKNFYSQKLSTVWYFDSQHPQLFFSLSLHHKDFVMCFLSLSL